MKKVIQFITLFSFLLILTGCFKKESTTPNIKEETLETTYKQATARRPKAEKPIDNIFIALNTLKNATYYESSSSGTIVAKKAITLANQTVKNRRIITPEANFNESISISSFVKVAEQLYSSEDKILKRNAKKVTENNVTWENDTSTLSKESYLSQYGYFFTDPTRYVINEDTITSDITVENNGIGRKYTYKFNLDPEIAPYYYKINIKNLSNSSSLPTFKSIEMTITFDYKWRMTKISTYEVYEISISALGTVTCYATITETFRNINKPVEIPEKAFFSKHL